MSDLSYNVFGEPQSCGNTENEREVEVAKFLINKGYKSEKSVEAFSFEESGSLVLFTLDSGGIVFALPTAQVQTIERVEN